LARSSAAAPIAQIHELKPLIVDETPALEVGSSTVSRYLIEKYFLRYLQKFRSENNRDPRAEESRNWFRLFVAQQAIIESGRRAGYFERPQVTENVDHMERYMLTQTEGPYYDRLFNETLKERSETVALFRENEWTSIDCIVARFANRSAAEAHLGNDFTNCGVDTQVNRVMQCAELPEVQVLDEVVKWPFQPIEELGEVLLKTPVGRWTTVELNPLGVYYVLVRKRITQPGKSSVPEDDFNETLQEYERTIVCRIHQKELLDSCALITDLPLERNLTAICAALPATAIAIPESAINNFDKKILCSFLDKGTRRQVSVEEFCLYFNHLFIRSMPRTRDAFRRYLQSLAIEQLDYEAARVCKVDKEKRFAQDREGFRRFQVLELFERERILPHLGDLEAKALGYYNEHRTDFVRVDKIGCRLFRFNDWASATIWLRQENISDRELAPTTAVEPKSVSFLVISREKQVDGLLQIQPTLFHIPKGRYLGPFEMNGEPTVALKESEVDFQPAPYQEVEQRLIFRFQRPALDSAELEMSTDLFKRFGVKDSIDYRGYGAM
jgi:hypothetical protein